MKVFYLFMILMLVGCVNDPAKTLPIFPVVSADLRSQCDTIDRSKIPESNASMKDSYNFNFFLMDKYDECALKNDKKREFIIDGAVQYPVE